MRINIIAVSPNPIPHRIRKCRSYRNLVGQIFLGPCTSTQFDNDRIVEEEEEYEMVEGGPSNEHDESPSRELIDSERNNNNSADNNNNNNNNRNIGWQEDDNENCSDKEDDDEVEQATLELNPYNLVENNITTNIHYTGPPEIKVTTDDSLLQMAQEYRENFDGFAEINHFTTIEEMHDFIKTTLEIPPSSSETVTNKQERYLDILLNEPPENRFRRLFETSRLTVRQVLIRNEDIFQELFTSASLDDFPSPLAPIDDNEISDDDVIYENPRDSDVEENMKRWYMIEMVGLWLKMITDVKSYRAGIKKRVLMKFWGIENDKFDGIPVPLKYK